VFNVHPTGPIQFWLVRNSPGCNRPPRTLPIAALESRGSAAPTQEVRSTGPSRGSLRARSSGLRPRHGGAPNRTLGLGREKILQGACVSSIWLDSTAYLRTYMNAEQVGVGQRQHRPVQPTQGSIGRRQQCSNFAAQVQRRQRWQGGRNEGAIARGLPDVLASAI
jgi:hypothetical protein